MGDFNIFQMGIPFGPEPAPSVCTACHINNDVAFSLTNNLMWNHLGPMGM